MAAAGGDPDEIVRRVAAVLEEAWQRLASKQGEVIAKFVDNPRTPYTLATLEEFKQTIREFRKRVDQEARQLSPDSEASRAPFADLQRLT
ncbi:hypothetical protein [Streptomyces sp. ME19-01-6]|uniref:hypothetical protein n=1 Tax=Streptomyces sp. ME19-01-6 TaxID=3028686 RepID=UPI0029B31208|nr:hypothetical protein [Streptomyces sp. ME19-01-6]MDX3224547.1 hypothetical protein [Streptomyces sp. ME19-01-6]